VPALLLWKETHWLMMWSFLFSTAYVLLYHRLTRSGSGTT